MEKYTLEQEREIANMITYSAQFARAIGMKMTSEVTELTRKNYENNVTEGIRKIVDEENRKRKDDLTKMLSKE